MDHAALKKLYFALAAPEGEESLEGVLLPTPDCLSAARMRDALVREDWTASEALHLRSCPFCQRLEAQLQAHLWHPSKTQLFVRACGLSAGATHADIAYHLEQDRCRRCLQMSARMAPRAFRFGSSLAVAASILFLLIGLNIGSSSRPPTVAQGPFPPPLSPRGEPRDTSLGQQAFSIVKLDKAARPVPAKGWLALNDYGTIWAEKDTAQISYFVAQDDQITNPELRDGKPHHYQLVFTASVSVAGTNDEGWWYQQEAPGSFGVIVCYKQPTHMRLDQPTYPLYYTLDHGKTFHRWLSDGGTIGLEGSDGAGRPSESRLRGKP